MGKKGGNLGLFRVDVWTVERFVSCGTTGETDDRVATRGC